MKDVVEKQKEDERVFNTLNLSDKQINCKDRYEIIKGVLETTEKQKEDSLKNIKMECTGIAKGDYLGCNLAIAGFLLTFMTAYMEIFQYKKVELTFTSVLVFGAIIVLIAAFGINMHMRRQNAEKILMIIRDIENEKKYKNTEKLEDYINHLKLDINITVKCHKNSKKRK